MDETQKWKETLVCALRFAWRNCLAFAACSALYLAASQMPQYLQTGISFVVFISLCMACFFVASFSVLRRRTPVGDLLSGISAIALTFAFLVFANTVIPRVLGYPGESTRVTGPMTQIASFKTALEAFEIDCGRLPTTAEGFGALLVRPPDIEEGQWRGPYVDSIPKDMWGHDFVYRCPGIHNTNGFDIHSCGPDGVSKSGGDDADDINNWSWGGSP